MMGVSIWTKITFVLLFVQVLTVVLTPPLTVFDVACVVANLGSFAIACVCDPFWQE